MATVSLPNVALTGGLPLEISELLRPTHGTTSTGGTQLVSGFYQVSLSSTIFGENSRHSIVTLNIGLSPPTLVLIGLLIGRLGRLLWAFFLDYASCTPLLNCNVHFKLACYLICM